MGENKKQSRKWVKMVSYRNFNEIEIPTAPEQSSVRDSDRHKDPIRLSTLHGAARKGDSARAKRAPIWYFCLFFILIVLLAPKVEAIWDEPTAVPPNDNIYGVLTIGPGDQAKSGALKFGASGDVTPGYILEVASPGAQINDLNIIGILSADYDQVSGKYNFVANPTLGFVNIGNLDFGGLDIKLGVAGNISVGYKDANNDYSIPGRAIQGLSSGDYGVYGLGHGAGNSGVYGENTNTTGNCATDGCYGVEGSGVATTGVKGENPSGANGIGVKGESQGIDANDYGIYAENLNPAGKWAGVFEGKVQSTDEVVGSKFLPTKLQNSLIPYTSGQKVANYLDGLLRANTNKAFDGTNLWSVGNGYVSKVRVSDGFKIFDKEIGTNPSDAAFDGSFIWVIDRDDNKIRKVNPTSGVIECERALEGQPVNVAYGANKDGEYIWVSSYDNIITQFSPSACTELKKFKDIIGIPPQSGFGKIIFDGNYVWTIYYDSVSDNDAIIRIDNKGDSYTVYQGLPEDHPFDIFFDGSSYWLTSTRASDNANILTKFYFREGACVDSAVGKYCINNSSVSCTTDDECPIIEDYEVSAGPSYITFDGTYIWLANIGDTSLSRILAADPTKEERTDFPLGFEPKGLTFDGTNLWVGDETGLSKYYSGTGWGHTDLSMTLTLQDNEPLTTQQGNFNISNLDSESYLNKIGGNMGIGEDLSVLNNQWGGTNDEVITVSPNQTAECGDGYFIKNIVADLDGVVSEIQCRPL